MKKPEKKVNHPSILNPIQFYEKEYGNILAGLVGLLESARRTASRSVNSIITATYWEIGRQIVKYEKLNPDKVGYGEKLIARLANDLTNQFGRGFGRTNLFQMKSFFLAYPEIVQTVSELLELSSEKDKKIQTPSEQSYISVLSKKFSLPWSHYVRLLSIKNLEARRFLNQKQSEAVGPFDNWTVRSKHSFMNEPPFPKIKRLCLKRALKNYLKMPLLPKRRLKILLF
jgi:hypothetical protein